jgi:peptide/nickel transport system permease protein
VGRFIVRRALNLVLVLFAISVITFLIFYVLPGGGSTAAAKRIAGHGADAQTVATVRHDYGLDKPIYVQYVRLMGHTIDGSLDSYVDGSNVQDAIVEGIPATASLVIGAAVLWVAFGVLFGVLGALYAGRLPDRALSLLATLAISLPVFWLGAMLLYYLTDRVHLLPAGGYVGLTDDPWQWFTHLVLPWITLAALFIGFYSRVLRTNVLDALGADYVRTARAKGLSERRVLVAHVLRSALIPVVTLFGLDFGAAIGGGAILTESVFSLQGVGQYAAERAGQLDLPAIMVTTLYAAFFIVLLSALVDVAYALLDPRVRLHA